MSHSQPHAPIRYGLVFAALVILTAVTLGAAMLHLQSGAARVSLAVIIATIKASLVGYFFMHMKFERRLVWFIFLGPVALGIITVLALFPDIVLTALGGEIVGMPGTP